jgi:hypothetical protein
MKTKRIYNIFNRENLELLIRKTVKKKRKVKDILCYKEEEMDLYLEKINKNWKTRRKKPANKIVKILISSLSMKEFKM